MLRGGSEMASWSPESSSCAPGGAYLAAKATRKQSLDYSGGALGALLADLGAVLGRLGDSWGPPGPFLGAAGPLLGASLAPLEAS